MFTNNVDLRQFRAQSKINLWAQSTRGTQLTCRYSSATIYIKNIFETKSEIQAAFLHIRNTQDDVLLLSFSYPLEVSISRTYKTQFLPLSKHKSIPSPLQNKSDKPANCCIHMTHKSTYMFNSQGFSSLEWVALKTATVF